MSNTRKCWYYTEKSGGVITATLLIVIAFAVQDFFEDLGAENDWLMIATDVVYVSLVIGILLYFWRLTPLSGSRQNQMLKKQIDRHMRNAEEWQSEARKLVQGLGELINQQFTQWKLTRAEREVAFLLLKGFTFKDISAMRKTGEKTVRQQAAQIYAKAGLAGRAELSAYFLEDLLPAKN